MDILENNTNKLILQDNDGLKFYSYKSLIAIYTNRTIRYGCNLYLTKKWDYSKTTLKQLKSFIDEYTNIKYIDKKHIEKLIFNNEIIIIDNEKDPIII